MIPFRVISTQTATPMKAASQHSKLIIRLIINNISSNYSSKLVCNNMSRCCKPQVWVKYKTNLMRITCSLFKSSNSITSLALPKPVNISKLLMKIASSLMMMRGPMLMNTLIMMTLSTDKKQISNMSMIT